MGVFIDDLDLLSRSQVVILDYIFQFPDGNSLANQVISKNKSGASLLTLDDIARLWQAAILIYEFKFVDDNISTNQIFIFQN